MQSTRVSISAAVNRTCISILVVNVSQFAWKFFLWHFDLILPHFRMRLSVKTAQSGVKIHKNTCFHRVIQVFLSVAWKISVFYNFYNLSRHFLQRWAQRFWLKTEWKTFLNLWNQPLTLFFYFLFKHFCCFFFYYYYYLFFFFDLLFYVDLLLFYITCSQSAGGGVHWGNLLYRCVHLEQECFHCCVGGAVFDVHVICGTVRHNVIDFKKMGDFGEM